MNRSRRPNSRVSEDQNATESGSRHTEVYILIYPPRNNDATRHDLHWSLAWEVSAGNWKYINLNLNARADKEPWQEPGGQPVEAPRGAEYCPYCGARTRNEDGSMVGPRMCSIGRLSLSMRNRIEEIACGVPVCAPGGLWSCQHWILGLLRRMADDGIITQRVLEDTVGCAYHAWNDILP